MNPQISSSERRLVWSFVLGALIFLLVFEAIFLGGRYFLERKNHQDNFIEQTNALITNRYMGRINRDVIPPYIGIESLQTTLSGEVLSSQIRDLTIENISDILDSQTIVALVESPHQMISTGEYMIRMVIRGPMVTYFFSKERDDINILRRDIARFILLDILLLFPIWQLMKLHIRRTMRPIRENFDTMTHFVHDAGHELRTPLAIMSGNLQIMRDSNHVEYELIEESLSTIDSMTESIQWLLELADLRLPEGKQESNLRKIIDDEISRANNPQNILIKNTVSKKYNISASEQHLSIVIRNLLENAIKYNRENGEIKIAFEKNTLIISDTGIGMSEENLKRIFDRFYRINQNSRIAGSGIGLTLVERIAKLYEWDIKVTSEVGVGTTFRIRF